MAWRLACGAGVSAAEAPDPGPAKTLLQCRWLLPMAIHQAQPLIWALENPAIASYRFWAFKVPPGYSSNSSKTSLKLSATTASNTMSVRKRIWKRAASELRESYSSDVLRTAKRPDRRN
jgi:hypothetical protein